MVKIYCTWQAFGPRPPGCAIDESDISPFIHLFLPDSVLQLMGSQVSWPAFHPRWAIYLTSLSLSFLI